jgi:cytochrome c
MGDRRFKSCVLQRRDEQHAYDPRILTKRDAFRILICMNVFVINSRWWLLCAGFVGSWAVALSAHAADEKALAQAKNCLACHAIDHKVVGPAYRDVALKYAGQKEVASLLASKVMAGGGGVWGPVPMPANPQVNTTDAKRLVDWILSLK